MKARYYQDESRNAVFDYFANGGKGNPLVVAPTGTGKAFMIADFIKTVMGYWPTQRIVMSTHVKELVKNNAHTLQRIWPAAPLGICSSGLNRYDTCDPIIFGGVKTMKSRVKEIGWRDLILIDEAHLVSPTAETEYVEFILALMAINPNLKVVGYTATDYRLGLGKLTNGNVFTDVAYDISRMEDFNRLIREGYLAPLYPKRTRTELDTGDVSIAAGEFNQKQLQAAVDQQDITYKALVETMEYGQHCQKWLVFASGVEHAEHVAEMLRSFGVSAYAIHAKVKPKERDSMIEAYKNDQIKCLVNNNVLTTGFDHPPIDLIVMLRPTTSPGLWVQMLGRGTRPSPATGKKGCTVLDFAGNTRRLGPINDPMIPRQKGKGTGDAPVRICEVCGTYNHASARFCCLCENEFPRSQKLVAHAGTDELIKTDEQIIEEFSIDKVFYYKHEKRSDGSESLRVDYASGFRTFSEWVPFQKVPGLAKKWWKQRSEEDCPTTVDEALFNSHSLKMPKSMRVHTNKRNPEILSFEWGE